MNIYPEIILASESPRRKNILSGLGIKFIVEIPSSEEILDCHSPSLVTVINARKKAESVASRHHSSIVIGADTVIELDGSVLGKPGTLQEARRMLNLLSGRRHSVVTGVCIVRKDYRAECVFCDSTDVFFRKLDESSIDEYLSKVNTLDKAGAYAVQEHGDIIIGKIEGSVDNVIGFPSEKFMRAFSLWL